MDILSDKWICRFLQLAKHVSSWSKDDSTQTGSVIIDTKGHIVSFGYNGLPKRIEDCKKTFPERHQRPQKYMWYEHAERNAIYQANPTQLDCVMFNTHHPCADCSRAICQTTLNIVAVVYDTSNIKHGAGSAFSGKYIEEFEVASIMFEEANIQKIPYGNQICR